MCCGFPVVCREYNNQSATPAGWTSEVEVVWRNDAGTPVDMFWVPHEGDTETYAFTIPVAADKTAPAQVSVFILSLQSPA